MLKTAPLFPFLLALMLFASCGEYSKVLKSKDLELKYEKAIEYYEAGEYYKAYPLIEELIPVTRGTERGEELHYIYSYCDYHLGDYSLAAARFQYFTRTFPASKYTEECYFMSAYCYYINSPQPSLDQRDTKNAIVELQDFQSLYPNSSRIDSCNKLINKLHVKLEEKAYANAKLYLKTRYYKAAVIAFDNMLEDFPDTKYREEALFLALRSRHLLAQGSVISKKEERLIDVRKAYVSFIDEFPASKRLREAENIFENAERDLEVAAYEIPEQYIELQRYSNAIEILEEKVVREQNHPRAEYMVFLLHKAHYLQALKAKKEKRAAVYAKTLKRFDALEGRLTTEKYLKKVAKYRSNLESPSDGLFSINKTSDPQRQDSEQ